MSNYRIYDREAIKQYLLRHPEKTYNQIAAAFGCCSNVVVLVVKANHLERARGNKSSFNGQKIALYAAAHPELSQSEIAAKFHTTQSNISFICRKYGVAPGRKGHPLPAAEVVRILKAVRENPRKTYQEIADQLGIGYWRVHCVAQKKGFNRDRGLGKYPHALAARKKWYDSLTPEERLARAKRISAGLKKWARKRTPEERLAFGQKVSAGLKNMSPAQKAARSKNLSAAHKKAA
jgi:hypothetical protein